MLVKQPGINVALPFYQQVLLAVIGPPIMTGIWWLLAGGLATSKNSVVRNSTDRVAFVTILLLTYFIMISITLYERHVRR